VSGTTVALLTAGNCTITASQAGNSSFAAASVARTFAVTNAASSGSAINGKALYASNSCGSCHGTVPAGIVLAAANSPSILQASITNNLGGMGRFSPLTSQNLMDIAAYLATPAI
jgi:mono/diheme cytochrome c family protein